MVFLGLKDEKIVEKIYFFAGSSKKKYCPARF
jgi:hypothetical protein